MPGRFHTWNHLILLIDELDERVRGQDHPSTHDGGRDKADHLSPVLLGENRRHVGDEKDSERDSYEGENPILN